MTLRRGRVLCIVVLVFAVSAANASPTVLRQITAAEASRCPDDRAITAEISGDAGATAEGGLRHLVKELLQPPTTAIDQGSAAQSLPAVPGAVFMVLTGFACVSLVRDRRFWMAAIAGTLTLGQAGLERLPELGWRLRSSRQTEQRAPASIAFAGNTADRRARADIEGRQYIGLLRYLAGLPADRTAFSLPASLLLRRTERSVTALFVRTVSAQNQNEAGVSHAIVDLFSYLGSTSRLPVRTTGQYIRLSPAFSLQYLGRGPPKAALDTIKPRLI